MGKLKDLSTNWSTADEARMDIIGSNGNDALGYLAPLTNNQIYLINREVFNTLDLQKESYCIKLARAIERAHGIEVKDE